MKRFALFFIALVTLLAAGSVNAVAAPAPFIVVRILGFTGPDCSAAVFEVSNQGDAEQPFGWNLTLSIKELQSSQTFTGQQPVAAGASFQSLMGTGVTTPGSYHVTIRAGAVLGPRTTQAWGRAVMRLPGACGGPSTPELLMPINNQAIQQNDPDTGCPFFPGVGHGFRIVFDWTDSVSSAGITGYQVFAEHVGSLFPIVDTTVPNSELVLTECGSYVAGPNLDSWHWRVRAIDALGHVSAWTEFGLFRFEPCLVDGVDCS